MYNIWYFKKNVLCVNGQWSPTPWACSTNQLLGQGIGSLSPKPWACFLDHHTCNMQQHIPWYMGRLHEKNRWETQMGKNRLGPTDVDGKGSMTIVDEKNRWGQSMGQWVMVTKTMGMFYTPIGGGKSWATVTKTMGMLLYHQTCELQQLMPRATKNVLC